METRALIRELLSIHHKSEYWKRIGYTPHAGQIPFHMSEARFKINTAGRRYGKTIAGVREIGPLVHVPNAYIWVVGPTQGLAVKEFRLFQRDLRVMARDGRIKLEKDVLDPVGGRYLLKVHGGATIEVRSQEKEDQMVGEGVVGVIMAEAARLKPHIWSELIRPTLTDYHGVAVFSTTPRGRNWYFELTEAAKETPDWAVFHNPSWTNPVVYPGGRTDPELLAVELSTPASEFRQEYGAEFVTHSGLVYDEFDPDIHVQSFDLLPDIPVNGWVDMGFHDPFVCLVSQVDLEGCVYIHDEYYFARKTPSEHAARLEEWFNRPGGVHAKPEILYCDPRSPDGIKDLKIFGWEAKAAPALDRFRSRGDNPIIIGVKAVKRLLQVDPLLGRPQLLIHPRCKETIKEFGLYEWVNDQPDPKRWNHACFPAGTMIDTPEGPRPIETLRAGDLVYTHLGVGMVEVGATQTRDNADIVLVQCGPYSVYCTPDHPFLTAEGKWVEAQHLEGQCLLRRQQPKSLSTKDASSSAIPSHFTRPTTISDRLSGMVTVGRFIRSCGKRLMVPSPTVTNCTTSTKTRRTTRSAILRWFQRDMQVCTILKTWQQLGRQLRLGMPLLKGADGIVNTARRPGVVERAYPRSATSAGTSFSMSTTGSPTAFARTPASPHGDAPRGWTTRIGSASSAVKASASTAMSRRRLAPVGVEASSEPASVTSTGRKEPVYNLATSDGTIFAGGFLQSQCDALRYGVAAEVARNRPGLIDEEEDGEAEAKELLGDDNYNPIDDYDEPFYLQRLRQRQLEYDRARRARAAEKMQC